MSERNHVHDWCVTEETGGNEVATKRERCKDPECKAQRRITTYADNRPPKVVDEIDGNGTCLTQWESYSTS